MTPNIKPLVAGNWKMNGLRSSLDELNSICAGYNGELDGLIDLLICPPSTLLQESASLASKHNVMIGAQDCHAQSSGAHTGDISAEMIADSGAKAVIVGHSERRSDCGETNEIVLAKAQAGLRNGLMTIVCIGEKEEERKSGSTLKVLEDQLKGSLPDIIDADLFVVAYEPVWAIGTGLVPSAQDVEEAHTFIREQLVARYGEQGSLVRILYGGSVKPTNAQELMAIANVDGALVGGASLKAEDFLGICSAYTKIG